MNDLSRNAFKPCGARNLVAQALLVLLVVVVVGGQLGEVSVKNVQNIEPNGPDDESEIETKTQGAGKGHVERSGFHQSSTAPEEVVISIESTFITCVNGSSIMSNVTYLNLTQVLQNEEYRWEDSEAAACFMFCKTSLPSQFISVQEAFGQSTHSCGCHDQFQEELNDVQQEESICTSTPGFMKLYCGPTNFVCFNESSKPRSYTVIILGSLVLLYLFDCRRFPSVFYI